MSVDGLQAWIHAFGWMLVHFLWQGAAVGLAYAVVRALIPRDHGEARYAVGLVALAALVACPLVTLWLLRPSAVVAEAGASVELAALAMAPIGVGATGFLASLDLSWLVAAWVAGVVIMTARALCQWRALEHIATRLAWREAEVDALFMRVAARFGGVRGVCVLVSRHLDTPTLIGWFNPVILLPAAVVLGFPRHQLELILAHELGHLRRHDHLVNFVQATIETLLFYHPVVHWISREVRHDREICCDRLVLHLTEGEPHEYARTLAALEHLRQLPPQLAVAASGGRLLDRVRRIVGLPSMPDARPRGAWFALAGGVGVFAVALAISHWDDDVVTARTLDPVASREAAPIMDRLDTSVAPADIALPRLDPPLAAAGSEHSSAPALPDRTEEEGDDGAPVPVLLPVPPPARTEGAVAAAAFEVSDLEATMVPAAEVPQVRPLRQPSRAPKLVRRVDPVYPEVASDDSRGHVEFEFSLERNGSVRDINVVSGDARGMFANAARHALRQWRFDPRDSARVSGQRFRQDFVFAGISRGLIEEAGACQRSTGSHLCRPARVLGLSTEVELETVAAQTDAPLAFTSPATPAGVEPAPGDPPASGTR
ncbi:MAG: TonB family protein [Dokdonella sp.]|uniref:M56 family metallopeptidase n=1 Tax=Dokdonella sp. TaxID=2291710 RepID=UPI0031BEA1B5|nr:TonB family protein [Dokdonella sp.]